MLSNHELEMPHVSRTSTGLSETPAALDQAQSTDSRSAELTSKFCSRRKAIASFLLPVSAGATTAPPTVVPLIIAGVVPGMSEPGRPLEEQVCSLLTFEARQRMQWLPWSRAYSTAMTHPSVIFPLARTPERDASWQWVHPLMEDRLVLIIPGRVPQPSCLTQSLRSLRVGVINSCVFRPT